MFKPGMEWPPKPYARALNQIARDAAWLTGDLNQIREQTHQPAPRPYTSRAQFNGGLVGATARGVFGRPQITNGSATIERHLPLAAELAEAKGSMMLGHPPAFTLHPDDATNEKADEVLQAAVSTDQYAAALTQMGTRLSGLGWTYGKLVWNLDVDPLPWIEWVDPDQGVAEFANGRVTQIHFWDTYTHDRDTYRLIQTHRPGRIEYQLYKGTDVALGMTVPVTECPETEYLADMLDMDAGINTGTEWLTAVMIPNRDQNLHWRTDPLLRYYGMSDIQAASGLLQDVDKAYTELWHEMDSGRARLLISEEFMHHGGPGSGQVFDWWRDVYPLTQGGSPDEAGRIERVQFDLRTEAYLTALDFPIMRTIGAFGLSPITVGMDSTASGEMTATEIKARSTRTLNTFNTTARHLRSGLSAIETARLALTAHLHGFTPPTKPVNVALVEPVQETERDRSAMVQEWHSSDSASTRTRVRTLHPEWTKEEVEEEVAEILRERREGMPVDPFTLTPDTPPLGMVEEG